MDHSFYLSLRTPILDIYLTFGLQVDILHYVSVRMPLAYVIFNIHE